MITKCPRCHSENPTESRFCKDCGTRIIVSNEVYDLTQILEAPKEKDISYRLGLEYKGEGYFKEAIEEFHKTLQLDPNYGSGLNEIAYTYANLNDFEKAIDHFEMYAAVAPGDANPYDFMAELCFIMRRLDEAIKVGEEIELLAVVRRMLTWYVISYNVPFLKDVLARTYGKNGELEKAIAVYERLIGFDPQSEDRALVHPLYHYRVAKLYEEKGWEGKAIEHYEKFLGLWKDADLRGVRWRMRGGGL